MSLHACHLDRLGIIKTICTATVAHCCLFFGQPHHASLYSLFGGERMVQIEQKGQFPNKIDGNMYFMVAAMFCFHILPFMSTRHLVIFFVRVGQLKIDRQSISLNVKYLIKV